MPLCSCTKENMTNITYTITWRNKKVYYFETGHKSFMYYKKNFGLVRNDICHFWLESLKNDIRLKKNSIFTVFRKFLTKTQNIIIVWHIYTVYITNWHIINGYFTNCMQHVYITNMYTSRMTKKTNLWEKCALFVDV